VTVSVGLLKKIRTICQQKSGLYSVEVDCDVPHERVQDCICAVDGKH